MYDTNVFNVAPEQLMVAARREGILWLVIVKPGAGRLSGDDAEKSIKVKSVLRGYEVEGERSPSNRLALANVANPADPPLQCLERNSIRG